MKVLDFYAEWCGPCKSLAPILEKVTTERNIELQKINIEEDKEDLCQKYGIRNIPTVVVIDEDKELDRFTGSMGESVVNNFFDNLT